MSSTPDATKTTASRANAAADPTVMKIPIEDFPFEMRKTLRAYDLDGDGFVTLDELKESLERRETAETHNVVLRSNNSILKKLAIVAIATASALVGATAGLTSKIIRDNTDTVVEGRALMNKLHEPVATNINTMDVPLGALAHLVAVDPRIPAKITQMVVQHPDGEMYYLTTNSIVVKPQELVTLDTTDGDVITWDSTVEEGREIHIALANGKSWTRPAACAECTATSIVVNEEIEGALVDFLSMVDADGQRRLNSYCISPLPQEGTLTINLIEATNLKSKDKDDTEVDAYIRFTIEHVVDSDKDYGVRKSTTKTNDPNPTYNERFVFKLPTLVNMRLSVKVEDDTSTIGKLAAIDLEFLDLSEEPKKLRRKLNSGKSYVSLELSYTK